MEDKAKRPSDISTSKTDHGVTAAKAALSLIPVPGVAGLATYLDDYYPDQVKRQIQDFRKVLLDHAEQIDRVNCDVDRLGSLTSQVYLEVPKSTSEYKRAALRAILLNFAAGKSAEAHEVDAFVSILSPLTDLEMEILRVAKSPREYAIQKGLIDAEQFTGCQDIPLGQVIQDASEELLMFAFNGLRAKQIIHAPELPGAAMGGEVCLGHLKLSQLGTRFLEWIEFEA